MKAISRIESQGSLRARRLGQRLSLSLGWFGGTSFLRTAGWLLVAFGVGHLVPFLLGDRSWEGPTSFRKPILFGISTGITAVSIAWVWAKLRPHSSDRWLPGLIGGALMLEVLLIAMQQWRGVPSHFNRNTTFDALMSSSIEALILLASVTIVWLSWRSWTSMRADIEMDIASAIRGGMFLLIVACALGFVASYFGHQGIARQQDPETYGQAGVLKFPHGIPIHAIQFLPVLVWSLSKLSVPLVWRRQAARLATAGIFVLTLFGAVQTFSGVGRFDLSGPSTLILIIGLCLLIGSVCIPLLRSHRGGEANE